MWVFLFGIAIVAAASPANASTTHYLATATDPPRANSSWGTGSTGAPMLKNERGLTFWGRFVSTTPAKCQQRIWGYNARRGLSSPLGVVKEAYSPDCPTDDGVLFGPSVEADVTLASTGATVHLVRTVASTGGPFGTYGKLGQGPSHANKFIGAAYVTLNPPWRASEDRRMKPFGAPELKAGRLRAAIVAVQYATAVELPEPSLQQLQQALRIVFINEQCNISTSRSFCQISLNVKTLLAGFQAYGPKADARVLDDPAQNGLIVFLGPMNQNGHNTSFNSGSVAGRCTAWSSWGNATVNKRFGEEKTFHMEVRWEDFKGCILQGTTDGNPAPVFGPKWDVPDAWVLKEVGYGQENYNHGSTTSVIEGLFQSLEVRSIGF